MNLGQAAAFFKTRWKWKSSDRASSPAAQAEVHTSDDNKDVRDRLKNKNAQKVISDFLQDVVQSLSDQDSSAARTLKSDALRLVAAGQVSPDELLAFGNKLDKLSKMDKKVATGLKRTDRNSKEQAAWDKINEELAHLHALEEKGEKLEFSDNLTGAALSTLEVFLGPAGPLLRVARELKDEYGKDIKEIGERMKGMGVWINDRAQRLRNLGRRSQVLFSRHFPVFSTALGKFFNSLKDKTAAGVGRMRGKFGKVLSVGQSVAQSPLGQAAIVMAAAGIVRAKAELEDLDIMKAIRDGLDGASTVVSTMYGGLSSWVSGSWNGMLDLMSVTYQSLKNKAKGLIEESIKRWQSGQKMVGDMIDGVGDWLTGIWDKIANFLPDKYNAVKSYAQDTYEKSRNSVANFFGVKSYKVIGGGHLTGSQSALEKLSNLARGYSSATGKDLVVANILNQPGAVSLSPYNINGSISQELFAELQALGLLEKFFPEASSKQASSSAPRVPPQAASSVAAPKATVSAPVSPMVGRPPQSSAQSMSVGGAGASTSASAPPSKAPETDNMPRLESVSKHVYKTVDAPTTPPLTANSGAGAKLSVASVPSYIGDASLLTLNLGVVAR